MSLNGKIAVVTGAGSGMRLATVRAFIREGATVYALVAGDKILQLGKS